MFLTTEFLKSFTDRTSPVRSPLPWSKVSIVNVLAVTLRAVEVMKDTTTKVMTAQKLARKLRKVMVKTRLVQTSLEEKTYCPQLFAAMVRWLITGD